MEDGGGQVARRRLRDPKIPLLAGVLLQRTGQPFVSSDFSFPPSPEQPWRIQVEIPSLGNSHHWAKNHTATTITKSNRSFIFILLGFSRFSVGVHAVTIRLSGKVPVDERRKFVLCCEADEGFPDFSFPDEKQRRYAPDPVIRSGFRGLIHVHFDYIRPTVVRLGDLFQNRCVSPTGPAPRRPEIDQRRPVRFQYGRFKVVVSGMPNPLFRFHFSSLP
jgi:hypothetical protein